MIQEKAKKQNNVFGPRELFQLPLSSIQKSLNELREDDMPEVPERQTTSKLSNKSNQTLRSLQFNEEIVVFRYQPSLPVKEIEQMINRCSKDKSVQWLNPRLSPQKTQQNPSNLRKLMKNH